jgi:hypothetical protein
MNLWKSLSLKWKQIAYYLLVGVTPPPGSFLYHQLFFYVHKRHERLQPANSCRDNFR